jgi:hypothetical protein
MGSITGGIETLYEVEVETVERAEQNTSNPDSE